MQQKRNTCLAFPGRVSRVFSLLLLLLLCGTASAELVYTVVSKDYSIGRVNYDAGGLPQNETVLKDIKADEIVLDPYSNDKGEWRVLTEVQSSDYSFFTLSLYDPDKDWKTPLAGPESLCGCPNYNYMDSTFSYIHYQDDSSLYLVSNDYSSNTSSYTVSKVDKENLAVTKGSETMKAWPDFGYLKSEGIIYSLKNYGENPSLTVLDKDLKGKTFALDAGNYDYPISLGDGSLAMTFVSEDRKPGYYDEDEEKWVDDLVTTKDLGIFKFTPSAKTRIVTSTDVGFGASDTRGSIGSLTSDKNGGLYFVVNKYGTAGSSTLYHWDGSRTTSVFKAAEGESIGTYGLDGSGNIYCSVSKHVRNESTQTSTVTTSLYRVGTSTPVYTETYTGTTGTDANLWINDIESDNSGNVYFMVYKSTSGWSQGHGDGPTSAKSQSRALYRCGASQATATKLHETTDGSEIDYFWVSSSSSSSSSSKSRFCDDSGNVYFKVYKLTQDANYNTTYASYALYRCGVSATSATKLHEETNGSTISYAGMDDSDNLYFEVCSQDVGPGPFIVAGSSSGRSESEVVALYRCGPSQTTPDVVKKVTDGSYIIVDDIPKESSNGVYFAVVNEKWEAVTLAGEEEEEAPGPTSSKPYISSYAFCHYDGTDVSTIHTFNNVADADAGVDEKHKVLYLSAVSRDVAAGSTLLAFDNTDRHDPEKLEEFEVAGMIGDVALYNDTVSPVTPSAPTRSNSKAVAGMDVSKTPASGWTSFPFTITKDGVEPPAGTVFKIFIYIISPLSPSVASANINDPYGWDYYCEGLDYKEGVGLDINTSKMKLFDKNNVEVSDFPGGDCFIKYEGGGFSGWYDENVKLAQSSKDNPGGGGGSSGGCDAGFGALALAVLAAGVLLKKHSK